MYDISRLELQIPKIRKKRHDNSTKYFNFDPMNRKYLFSLT